MDVCEDRQLGFLFDAGQDLEAFLKARSRYDERLVRLALSKDALK